MNPVELRLLQQMQRDENIQNSCHGLEMSLRTGIAISQTMSNEQKRQMDFNIVQLVRLGEAIARIVNSVS